MALEDKAPTCSSVRTSITTYKEAVLDSKTVWISEEDAGLSCGRPRPLRLSISRHNQKLPGWRHIPADSYFFRQWRIDSNARGLWIKAVIEWVSVWMNHLRYREGFMVKLHQILIADQLSKPCLILSPTVSTPPLSIFPLFDNALLLRDKSVEWWMKAGHIDGGRLFR